MTQSDRGSDDLQIIPSEDQKSSASFHQLFSLYNFGDKMGTI